MTTQEKNMLYEAKKKELRDMNLTYKEYEKRLRDFCNRIKL